MNFLNNTAKQILATSTGFVFMFAVQAQDGEALFRQNCGACHKVDKGRSVGPGLLDVTTKRSEDWLLKWTKSSQSLVKSGDADANAIFKQFDGMVMPDQALPDADIKAIFAFIASKSTPTSASTDTSVAEVVPDASNNATPEQIELGKRLFSGSTPLINGGVSCISCHNVTYAGVIPGGLLAKDLTTVYSRLGGDVGLQGILGAPPFPAMTQAYKDRPITETEIAAITAFLNKVDKDKDKQVAGSFNYLLYGGGFGLICLFGLGALIWYDRKQNSVKKGIFDRQLKSVKKA